MMFGPKDFYALLIFVAIFGPCLSKENFHHLSKKASRIKRFSIFHVVQFRNIQCTVASSTNSESMKGTCYTQSECESLGGIADGNCASGFGVCCMFLVSKCGSTVNRNCTYIRNPDYPSGFTTVGACNYFFNTDTDVCQIRLDFDNFNIASAGANGVCATDQLNILSPGSSGGNNFLPYPPQLCGQLTGSHIYVETGRSDGNVGSLTVNIGAAISTITRTWKIKASYIECSNPNRAPTDCLQYFTSDAGTFQSFNFQNGNGQLMAGLNYNACFRQNEGFCELEFSAGEQTFNLLPPAAAASMKNFFLNTKNTVAAVSKRGCYGAGGSGILIPTIVNNLLAANERDTYCGAFLNVLSGNMANGVARATTTPWNVAVFSESVGLGLLLTSTNTGFNLVYNQVPC